MSQSVRDLLDGARSFGKVGAMTWRPPEARNAEVDLDWLAAINPGITRLSNELRLELSKPRATNG